MAINMLKQYKLRNYKFILIIFVVTLSTLGVFLVGSAKPSLMNKQLLGMMVGIVLMVAVSLIDYNFIMKFSWLIYLFTVGILLAVIAFGDDAGGAQRWIDLKFMRFQPSELTKVLLIYFFAYYFMKHEEKINTFKILVSSFILVGIPMALIMLQPDLSTTIVTALIFVALLFVAGLSYKIIISVLAIAVPAFVILFTSVLKLLVDWEETPFSAGLPDLEAILFAIFSLTVAAVCAIAPPTISSK